MKSADEIIADIERTFRQLEIRMRIANNRIKDKRVALRLQELARIRKGAGGGLQEFSSATAKF